MIGDVLQDINPRIVHKENKDDVLIYNNRPAIPVFLEKKLIDNVDGINLDELKSFYVLKQDRYVLRTIYDNISHPVFNALKLYCADVPIEGYYEQVGDEFVLCNQWLPEHLEITFSRFFKLYQKNQINGKERCQIYEILKKIDGINLINDGHYTLFNDAQNYFFYSKHHEHVPGLMIIEAARQCMYVHFYERSGYERGAVTISILDLNCTFPNYTEACYSVEIIVKDLEMDRPIRARSGTKVAQFYQNDILVAEISLKYIVIAMPVFNRMRNINIPDHQWFTPLKNVRKEVLLISKDETQIQGNLQFISINEIKIIINDNLLHYKLSELKSKLSRCIINVDGHGLIYMQVDSNQSIISEPDNTAIIAFIPFDRKQKDLITKILKDYCYFVEDKSHSDLIKPESNMFRLQHD